MQTLYYSKQFMSGRLAGCVVHQQVTASDVSFWHIGRKGKDALTGARWTIVDASYQKYAR